MKKSKVLNILSIIFILIAIIPPILVLIHNPELNKISDFYSVKINLSLFSWTLSFCILFIFCLILSSVQSYKERHAEEHDILKKQIENITKLTNDMKAEKEAKKRRR